MNQLFYQLLYKEKSKRWFSILDQLEENRTVTAKTLAHTIKCTHRTIQSDVKQLKQYFGTSIVVLGDEAGYHFSFQDPIRYAKEKQMLLDKEPLIIMVNHLIDGRQKSNQEWAGMLSVSDASFRRMKYVLGQLLYEQYQITITDRDNQLKGTEFAIRQFMYDFYFKLPVYSRNLVLNEKKLVTAKQKLRSGRWDLDPVRINQWGNLAYLRISQGHLLDSKEDQEEIQHELATAFDEILDVSLPKQEKAFLFLLSLREEQFLNPLRQKEFMQQFSPAIWRNWYVMDYEEVTILFIETIVQLLNSIVHLSSYKSHTKTSEQSGKSVLFKELMETYLEGKQRFERSLVLKFDLIGSSALKEWIMKIVRHQLQTSGYYIVEESQASPYMRKITITNTLTDEDNPHMVCLSKIPEGKEIQQALHKIEW